MAIVYRNFLRRRAEKKIDEYKSLLEECEETEVKLKSFLAFAEEDGDFQKRSQVLSILNPLQGQMFEIREWISRVEFMLKNYNDEVV